MSLCFWRVWEGETMIQEIRHGRKCWWLSWSSISITPKVYSMQFGQVHNNISTKTTFTHFWSESLIFWFSLRILEIATKVCVMTEKVSSTTEILGFSAPMHQAKIFILLIILIVRTSPFSSSILKHKHRTRTGGSYIQLIVTVIHIYYFPVMTKVRKW